MLKKLSALVVALVMVLTMGLAFADGSVNTDGTVNADKGIESTENTINIAKQIVFVNDENTTIREPNIVYTYTISSVDPSNATIKDKNEMTGTVKAGVMAAVTGATTDTTSTVTFKDTATSAASASGTSTASKYAAFTFTPANFTTGNPAVKTPGIYRYKISETTSVTKASVGITEASTYKADRYLDVYVHWTDTDHTTLGIYGYVLYEGTATQSITSEKITDGDVSMKSTGYVNTATSGTPVDVDVYTTENLYINKTTTGNLADKNNNFPIQVTLTAPSEVSNTKLDVTVENGGSLTTTSDTIGDYVAAWGTVNGTVKDTTKIAIKGIPAGAKVSIVETNNTPDSYKVKAGTTADAKDLLDEKIISSNASTEATSDVTINAKSEIFITNTLEDISPTGLVLRFAPYVLMLAAGIALLLISRRRKASKTED